VRTAFHRCPKCRHAPLPVDQRLPASCPACGVILAKLAPGTDSVPARLARTSHEIVVDGNGAKASWKELLFDPGDRAARSTLWIRSALLLAFAVWGIVLICCDVEMGDIMKSFIHGPLLVFHEAGHVVFRLGGEWIMVLGGTLGQLLMPAVMMVALLLKNRDAFGASLAFWLFGVSLLDIAPYVYDALEPQLMLLSGSTGEAGGHDWIYLLRSMHLLQRAHGLGAFVHAVGTLVVLAAIAWAGWLLARQWKMAD
jgi:hypothetical protein